MLEICEKLLTLLCSGKGNRMSDTPHIDGSYKSTVIDPTSQAGQKLLSVRDTAENCPVLAENEVVDIVEAGACLVELPGGTIHLVVIESGSITGPAKLTQVPIRDAIAAMRDVQAEKKREMERAKSAKIEEAKRKQREADARLLAEAIEKSKTYELPAAVPTSEVEAVDTQSNKSSCSVAANPHDFTGSIGDTTDMGATEVREKKLMVAGLDALRYFMVAASIILGTFLFVQPYVWDLSLGRMILSCFLGSLNLFVAYIHFDGRFVYVRR
jgi:hypothetical protein